VRPPAAFSVYENENPGFLVDEYDENLNE